MGHSLTALLEKKTNYQKTVTDMLYARLADAFFFSQLVTELETHDKIVIFCGAGHVDDALWGKPENGLVPVFRELGCDVRDIESVSLDQISKYKKCISPSRLQEIFTNFLSCCNTCGKTKICLKNENMKSCRRCHAVTYCSRDCQRKDWKNHKKLSPGCAKKKKK